MGLKSWAKKRAKDAKRKAGQAKREAKKAADAAKRKADEAARAAKRKAEEAKREAEKLADRAAKELTVGLIDDLKGVASAGKREVEKAAEKAVKDVEKGVTEKLPELIEEALAELAEDATKNAAKKALEIACDVIETTAPDTYTLTFGVELALIVQGEVTVSLELPNPVARLSKIRAWAEKPPSGRAQIIECVKDFAPQSLTVEGKISGNGGSATYSGEHIYDGLDAFLQKNGVD